MIAPCSVRTKGRSAQPNPGQPRDPPLLPDPQDAVAPRRGAVLGDVRDGRRMPGNDDPDLVSTIWEIAGAAEDEEVKAALTAG